MSKRDLIPDFLRLREAGHVRRCHTTPCVGDAYTVGKHTFDCLLLVEALHPAPSAALLRAVLRHDLHERYTGDTPGFLKRVDPDFWTELEKLRDRTDDAIGSGLEELTSDEQAWLAAVDSLELLLWCEDQLALGNKNVNVMRRDVINGLSRRWGELPAEVQEFVRYFQWQRTDDEL